MSSQTKKILLVRFSSFGDVLQTLSVVDAIKKFWPDAEIHWITRSEFLPLIENHPALFKAWGLNKKTGIKGLWALAQDLNAISFTHIYDAHNNMRSHILGGFLFWMALFSAHKPPKLLRRSIRRWKRFLLFSFRKNLFEQPFSGQRDLIEPLQKWGLAKTTPSSPQLFISESAQTKANEVTKRFTPFVAMAPSAAYPLKRWPLHHWRTLVQKWHSINGNLHFVFLGGPEDHFIKDLVAIDPNRVHNFAGALSLSESAAVVQRSLLLIANDTGLLHVGEQLGHPTIALMGPAPFGFPSRYDSTTILELPLPCRPCSKHGQGPCRNPRFQECLEGISPDKVLEDAQKRLKTESKELQ